MKMQKRVFMAMVSKLGSFRRYGLPHLISDRNISGASKSPACWLRSTGRGNRKSRCSSMHAQSDQYLAVDYLEDASLQGEDNWRQVTSSDVLCNDVLKIGVLDDNPAILGLIETVLTTEGHRVSKYVDGSSLLDAFFPQESEERLQYDLVILDLLLPGTQSGADVFFAIRQRFSADVLPIIVITAVDEPTLKQFRHILPDDVPLLRKPFDPRKLRQLIGELTGQIVNKGT